MDVEIWSEEQMRFLGLCIKRGPAYQGPYPTTVLQFQPNIMLLSANSWIYLLEVSPLRIAHSRNMKRRIASLAAGRRMIVIVMSGEIQLLNERLQTVRIFELQPSHQIAGLFYTTKGFLVHYHGEPQLNSQPLVRFMRASQQPVSCYHQNMRIHYDKGTLRLENLDNNFT